ncbi:MAG TPA: hypothetical protein VK636_12160 [Gemmatimonadaceae bacterium]|nr:hypothetical protein [Gemmatimonadaceae bacterium]
MRVSYRPGSVLIEVLVALVLLAVAGSALITLLGQTAHSMRTTLESERLARSASEQLDGVAVATRADLIARQGRTSLHGWTVQIVATSMSLFDVSVFELDGRAPVLTTTLYRPDSSDAR